MKIGAIWIKESKKDGKKYMSGLIQFPGMNLHVAIFKNEEKTEDRHPDYNIVWSPEQKKSQSSAPVDDAPPFSDNDIPF